MDRNISVYAPFIDRVERSKKSKNENFNRTTANHILGKEMSELDKNSLADNVIHNYKDHGLIRQVGIINEILI